MGDLFYAIASGVGFFLGLLLPYLLYKGINKYEKKLTPEQKKKFELKLVISAGVIFILLMFFGMAFMLFRNL